MPTTNETRDTSDAAVWWGWGDEAGHAPLPAAVRELLEALLGVPAAADRPPVALADVVLPPAALPDAAQSALARIVGAEHVRADRETRVRHCRGRSTADLLRIRAGDGSDAPDAVVYPGGHEQVLAVLRACAEQRVAVVPFGGGTSVVGGLTPLRAGFDGVVALDLRRMGRVLAVDAESQTAVLEPGLRGPEAEALLAAEGLTLGHVPQSFEYATIGGFAATRSAGQASSGYGRFDDLVVGVRVATPAGTWELGRAPASAAGPDLRQLVLGSEGAFGVITAVRLRVRPLPEARRFEAWHVADFQAGVRVVRLLAQADALPTVCRLSDETETAAGVADSRPAGVPPDVAASSSGGRPPNDPEPSDPAPGDPALAAQPSDGRAPSSGGCYLITGYEGPGDWVAARQAAVAASLSAGGASPLGERPGQDWLRGRFRTPYLRDALLDAGMFVDTLETAGFWSDLPGLYTAVRDAVTGAIVASGGSPPLVLCHLSHAYPTGASLYFTVVCAQGADPVAQWRSAKDAAGAAIAAAGGTITHHHAIGTDHQPWLGAEVGEVGVSVLRAVKRALDPAGILNPGILVPPAPPPPDRPERNSPVTG
jgi:alkyldihydroxyacetonephosphate synthase